MYWCRLLKFYAPCFFSSSCSAISFFFLYSFIRFLLLLCVCSRPVVTFVSNVLANVNWVRIKEDPPPLTGVHVHLEQSDRRSCLFYTWWTGPSGMKKQKKTKIHEKKQKKKSSLTKNKEEKKCSVFFFPSFVFRFVRRNFSARQKPGNGEGDFSRNRDLGPAGPLPLQIRSRKKGAIFLNFLVEFSLSAINMFSGLFWYASLIFSFFFLCVSCELKHVILRVAVLELGCWLFSFEFFFFFVVFCSWLGEPHCN